VEGRWDRGKREKKEGRKVHLGKLPLPAPRCRTAICARRFKLLDSLFFLALLRLDEFSENARNGDKH
jgi:hypothetical protein